MARIRTIKPDFFVDDEIANLRPLTRILFIGLWTLADRDGRLEDRPPKIQVQLLPYDRVSVDRLLDELDAEDFVIRYSVDGKDYIQIRSFERHQRPHPKEAGGVFPPADDPGAVKRREIKRQAVKSPEPSRRLPGEGKESMDNGKGTDTGYPPEFETFWTAYPLKKKKRDALKAWGQTAKIRPMLTDLLAKLEALKGSREWTKDGGDFIPYPASWLRADGWEDEIREPAKPASVGNAGGWHGMWSREDEKRFAVNDDRWAEYTNAMMEWQDAAPRPSFETWVG